MMTDSSPPATVDVGQQFATAQTTPVGIETASQQHAVDSLLSPNYFDTYDSLLALCRNNVTYYAAENSATGQRFHGAYAALIEHLGIARTHADKIRRFAGEYDFDAQTPGNGYRSFLLVVRSCVAHTLRLSTHVMQNRGALLFRGQLYCKEVEAASRLLASLCTCLQHLLTLRDWSAPASLFPRGVHSAAELFDTAKSIDQYSFYGRCLGVQYCESMQSVVRVLAVAMAGFSEAYYKEGTAFSKTTASMWTGSKYYMNPELRARRIVNISQSAEIDFCKSFWSLNEGDLMHALPNVLGTAIKVNCVIDVPAEPLQLPATVAGGVETNTDDDTAVPQFVDIPVPHSHLGAGSGSISVRLLSSNRRHGMIGGRENAATAKPPAAGLIVHCHGGGFVAQSSKSHELYLRDWAVALDVPILSIDYSLAPSAPFPRAVEEVFYAYCWALKNCALLGTRAERVLLAGDSAGANLNLACTIRCVETGVRVPDGLFLAYCPVRISFDPSPARLLCLMDPLLPFGFMMRCLKAYACPNATIIEQNRQRVEELERVRSAVGAGTVNGASMVKTLSADLVVGPSSTSNPAFDDNQQTATTGANNPSTATPTLVDLPRAESATISLDGGTSSLWEHIDNDFAQHEQQRSSCAAVAAGISDVDDDDDASASDTFASASLRSHSSGGGAGNNTDMMTPDESNGESLEEDSQPITIHRSMANGVDISSSDGIIVAMPAAGPSTSAAPQLVDDNDDSEVVVLERMNGNCVKGNIHQAASRSSAADSSSADKVPEIAVPTTAFSCPPLRRTDENLILDTTCEVLSVQNIHQKIIQVMDNVASSVTSRLHAMTASTPIRQCREFENVHQRLDAMQARNPSEEFVFEIPRDPLLSPYWASDEVLRQMPRTHILTVDMDPCLDDCVMFAKRLKELGRTVAMDILPGLPHGFLNFVKLSKEAHAGNKLCVKRLDELLNNTPTAK